jgi:hypothetical protein
LDSLRCHEQIHPPPYGFFTDGVSCAWPREAGPAQDIHLDGRQPGQTDVAKYLIEQSSNLFGEYDLIKEVRSNGLDEIEEILETKFKLSYRIIRNGFYIYYGGFDASAPYYLEGSADLKNWIKVGGSQRSFEHRQEHNYYVNVPQFMETHHYFRLRKAEE